MSTCLRSWRQASNVGIWWWHMSARSCHFLGKVILTPGFSRVKMVVIYCATERRLVLIRGSKLLKHLLRSILLHQYSSCFIYRVRPFLTLCHRDEHVWNLPFFLLILNEIILKLVGDKLVHIFSSKSAHSKLDGVKVVLNMIWKLISGLLIIWLLLKSTDKVLL